MTSIEQQIVDIIQDGFPISERPYAVLAEKLGGSWTEQSVFEAVERLRACGVIRRIGGVYDSRKLGYISRLCAGIVPAVSKGAPDDSALEKFAAVVAGIPAITHNYVRSHHYNVWFTVIAENEQFVQKIVDKLQKETDMYNVHILASKRMFKINTVMKGRDEKNDGVILSKRSASKDLKASSHLEARRATSYLVSDSDKLRIRLLSGDIPHTLTPFADLCDQCGCGLEEFLEGSREDLSARRMRRFGAVLRHQEAGFAHNAMVCFCIDERRDRTALGDLSLSAHDPHGGTRDERRDGIDERREAGNVVAEAGAVLASNPHVSHCYEREPFEDFPYNLYAMFHAVSASELDSAIAEAVQSLSQFAGGQSPDFAVLHSVRELKKTSFTFFAD